MKINRVLFSFFLDLIMAKKLVLERFTTPDFRSGGVNPVCATLAELANFADSLDDMERKNFQDIICGIKNQKGAQVGDDQIEIRRKTCIQISLEDNQSQWVGVAIFHTSPRFRKNTISSPEGQCSFTIQGPGGVIPLFVEESSNIGPVFVQAVELDNQDHVDISFDVVSSNECNNGKKSEARKWEIYVFPMGANPETTLDKCGLQNLLNRGTNMNIQVMAELRNIHRILKRPRSDFPTSSFASETSERDNFIKRAKYGYSEYLSNLGVDALKIEASRWD